MMRMMKLKESHSHDETSKAELLLVLLVLQEISAQAWR